MRLSSTDKKQIYQNNKRKYELCEAWTYIFELATHHKVAYFVCEELDFKAENHNENSNIANRKTKNIWHRELTKNLIQKHCNSLGIEKIGVIAAYSSFIGNVQFKCGLNADYNSYFIFKKIFCDIFGVKFIVAIWKYWSLQLKKNRLD